MGTCWGGIEEGVRIEVLNSDTNHSTKVYWIAEIVKLAGKTTHAGMHLCCIVCVCFGEGHQNLVFTPGPKSPPTVTIISI